MKQPKKCHHKPSDRAYLKINGRRIYLGKWNSDEADEAYEREILKWKKSQDGSQEFNTTVGELCLAFMEHAEEFYRDETGNQTGEAANYKYALRPLVKLFRNVKCCQFGPSKLMTVRNELAKVHVRQQVNNNLARIKRVFKWGVSQELIPVEVFAALQTVEGLKRNRSAAKESEPVLPVPIDDFNKTLAYLTDPLSRLVQFQILTGARPSEARLLTVGDINTDGEVWLYKPNSHKNKWRGKERTVCIGPKAQAVIMPFVEDAVSGSQFVFRPVVEQLLNCGKVRWDQLRQADWICFAITHWNPRLVMATQWLEMPEFRIWDVQGGTATGSTAHEAAWPLATFFDPGFETFEHDGQRIPDDVIGWNTDELKKLLAKLRQECVLLKEHAFPRGEDFSMKSLAIALDLSDKRVGHFANEAAIEKGERGRPRSFSHADARAICETILDDHGATDATKQAAMKLLNRLS